MLWWDFFPPVVSFKGEADFEKKGATKMDFLKKIPTLIAPFFNCFPLRPFIDRSWTELDQLGQADIQKTSKNLQSTHNCDVITMTFLDIHVPWESKIWSNFYHVWCLLIWNLEAVTVVTEMYCPHRNPQTKTCPTSHQQHILQQQHLFPILFYNNDDNDDPTELQKFPLQCNNKPVSFGENLFFMCSCWIYLFCVCYVHVSIFCFYCRWCCVFVVLVSCSCVVTFDLTPFSFL